MRYLLFARLLTYMVLLAILTSCHDQDTYDFSSRKQADISQIVSDVMAYISKREQSIPYLQERGLRNNDFRAGLARYKPANDSLFIQIPIIRLQRDSLATIDSLYFAPNRVVACVLITKDSKCPQLCFYEETPTFNYHKANRTKVWYKQFSGQLRMFNEGAHSVGTFTMDNGGIVRTRFAAADSTDTKDGGTLEEVEVTAPWKRLWGYGNFDDPFGYISPSVAGFGTDYDSGSVGGPGVGSAIGEIERKPTDPVIDCDDKKMEQAKRQVRGAYGKLLQATSFNVGNNKYVSLSDFQEKVRQNNTVEWNTFVRDYTADGFGVGLSDPTTLNLANKGSTDHLIGSETEYAAMHNHNNESPISMVDIMELIRIRTEDNCSNFSTMIAWDNINDEYYCATITDADMAKNFYNNYKQYVDFNTGYWNISDEENQENPTGYFLKNQINAFDNYNENQKNLYTIVAMLEKFDSGVYLVKIKTGKDAGGDIEYNYTSYGAAKAPKRKYMTIKLCP